MADRPMQETAGGWGCPHEVGGACQLRQLPCRPGVLGCVLHKWMKKTNEPEDSEEKTG